LAKIAGFLVMAVAIRYSWFGVGGGVSILMKSSGIG